MQIELNLYNSYLIKYKYIWYLWLILSKYVYRIQIT